MHSAMTMTKHTDARLFNAEVGSTYHHFLLAAITLIAAVLRFHSLGEWSFWVEEYHTLRSTASMDSLASVFLNYRPVFFLLSKPVLILLGVNEWTARLTPALIGILSIPICYWIVKRLFGPSLAFLSATFMAISPWHIYWSQNARFYTLLLLLFTLSAFAFYWGLERDNFRYIIASVVLLGLAGATHGIAILLLPIFVSYFLLLKLLPFEPPLGFRGRNIMPFFILPLVGYLVIDAYRVFYQGETPIPVDVYLKFFNGSTATFIGLPNPFVMLTAVIHPTGTPLALLALLGSLWLLMRKSRAGLFLSLAAFVPLGVMMVLTMFASASNRYVFMSLFFWILLGAFGIKELYVRANQHGAILFIPILGFLLLFLRDPAIKDLSYFLSKEPYFAILLAGIAFVFLACSLLLLCIYSVPSPKGIFIGSLGILVIAILHGVMADSIYYLYQHGHRQNWKAAITTIREHKEAADVVIAAMYTVGSYYLNEKVTDIQSVDLNIILQDGKRAWFVEDEYMDVVMDAKFEKWANANCHLFGNWDQYDTGRIQKLRVHLCKPN
jgi:uncharacterized membrane protein